MSRVDMKPRVDVVFTIEITEAEARVLADLLSYGPEPLTKGVIREFNAATIRNQEGALYSFFHGLRPSLARLLGSLDETKKTLAAKIAGGADIE